MCHSNIVLGCRWPHCLARPWEQWWRRCNCIVKKFESNLISNTFIIFTATAFQLRQLMRLGQVGNLEHYVGLGTFTITWMMTALQFVPQGLASFNAICRHWKSSKVDHAQGFRLVLLPGVFEKGFTEPKGYLLLWLIGYLAYKTI